MKNKGQKSFLAERLWRKWTWLPFPKPKNTVWTLNITRRSIFCHICFCWIHTYLVNVLQFVNNLTDHWLRALHFQLMEVELIFHSIPRCLLAVSGNMKVKKRFVTREFQAKCTLTVFGTWLSWLQATFSLPARGKTAWYQGRLLQIESTCIGEHSFKSQQVWIHHFFFPRCWGYSNEQDRDKVSALILPSV